MVRGFAKNLLARLWGGVIGFDRAVTKKSGNVRQRCDRVIT
jgi:hypothetical protein